MTLKIKLQINLLLGVVSFVLICRDVCAEEKEFKARNIFLVVMDGPRYSESWGDTEHKNIYYMSRYLAPQGVLYKNFFNKGQTLTNPGHAAMATGFYQDIDNGGLTCPAQPSYLQRWLKKTGSPHNKAWLIMSKSKIAVLQNTTDPKWQDRFLPSQNCGVRGLGVKAEYRSDYETFQQVLRMMRVHHPNLVFVNFKEPDASGHQGNWNEYLAGMRATDKFIYRLWKQIQQDPYYKNKTALFVTNDHGRHLNGHEDGFISHGDDCAGCRHISLLALGPDFKRGVEIDEPGELIDIPVTIGKMLYMDIPGSPGRFLNELFLDSKNFPSDKQDKKNNGSLQTGSHSSI